MRRSFILGLVVLNGSIGLPLPAGTVPLENPFAPILARNVFGLQPSFTDARMDPASATPPVKIIPNGIMTLFGKSQVLFKVLDAPVPGQPPPKEQAYLMSEGESQDGIEIEKIDTLSGIIAFNNHGVIQQLSLVSGMASGGGQDPDPGVESRSRLLAASHLAFIRRTPERKADASSNINTANASDQFSDPSFNSPASATPVPASLASTPEYNSAPVKPLAPQQNGGPGEPNNLQIEGAAQMNSGDGEMLTPAEAAGGDVPPLSQ